MRQKNPRVLLTGAALLALAMLFFFGMMLVAPKSNDPAELMRIVGTVSGVVGGLAVAMMAIGGVGKRA